MFHSVFNLCSSKAAVSLSSTSPPDKRRLSGENWVLKLNKTDTIIWNVSLSLYIIFESNYLKFVVFSFLTPSLITQAHFNTNETSLRFCSDKLICANSDQTFSECVIMCIASYISCTPQTPQIMIPGIEYDYKVSSHAQIWPQGAEKQLRKVNVGGGGWV